MSARRGEVPFVAIPVGKSHDPREVLGIAAELRIERPHALGLYALWHEFVLEVGDATSGRVRGYTAAHISAKLGWKGKPARLLAALKNAGMLATQKSVFIYPAWSETITGQYASRKAKDRDDWARQKAAQRDAARRDALAQPGSGGVDVQGMSTWTSGGRPGAVSVDIAQKERKESAGHLPPAPPQGGGELADARWRWLLEHHKRPTNPVGCRRILGALDDEGWAIVQWAAGLTPETTPRSLSRKKRVLALDTYRFLTNGTYLQIRPEWVAKLRQENPPAPSPGAAAKRDEKVTAEKALEEERATHFLLQMLADPDIDAEKKEFHRKRWIGEHPGQRPPWVKPPALQPAEATP